MATPTYRIVSIGALSAHPLWGERGDVRTGHATTTLIVAAEMKLLVNPGLPGQALMARMGERTRVKPGEITHVFLTTFTVEHYRSLPLFENAQWLVHEPERDAARRALDEQLTRAKESRDQDLVGTVQQHIDLLDQCQDAPDKLADNVDLFPLPGLSPGTCGLLLPLPSSTVLVCGDAIPTQEHLEEGKVLPTCMDVEQAQESFREAIEIADLLVPGRDNITANPVRQLM